MEKMAADPRAALRTLHRIEEDESEEREHQELQELGSTYWAELKQVEQEYSPREKPTDGQATSAKNSNSLVASVKKAISSLGSNASSSIENFVQITDCLKDSSETCSDQTDTIIPDLCIHLVMVRNGLPDPELQGELRNRLRLLENDNKEVTTVFNELSARLLSIQSDKDLITVTFKTFEEIWKFSTYYSLGFLNHCMENIFQDQLFWLSSPEEGDAEIKVSVNEETLNLIYKSLLMEEGMFFVLCADNHVRQAGVVDGALQVFQPNSSPEGLNVEWTQDGHAVPADPLLGCKAEPLCPFHEWFLKTNAASDLGDFAESKLRNKIAVGRCEAMVDYQSEVADEMTYKSGDIIETHGTFFECMEWFLGRNKTSGQIAFVKTSNVSLSLSDSGPETLAFLTSEENMLYRSKEEFDLNDAKELLHTISYSDVCNVYRVDELQEIRDPKHSELRPPTSIDSNDLKEKIEKFLAETEENQVADIRDNLQTHTLSTSKEAKVTHEEHKAQCFCIREEEDRQEALDSLLLFLNNEKYLPSFKNLYDTSCDFLHTLFSGYREEGELVRYLSMAREAAKKANMIWALTRICFLLGRLSVKRHKFSQARVYFEEAMGVIDGAFDDLFLISAVYANLTAVYLKQKHKEKCVHMIDKAASLIIGLESYISSSDMEPAILKYALKKAILSQDTRCEIRVCSLLAKIYTDLRQHDEALPFVERLQFLSNTVGSQQSSAPEYYFQLADMYSNKCLPHMALSCVKVASQGPRSFTDSLKGAKFVIENANKVCEIKRGKQTFPTQIAHYLRNALVSAATQQEQTLSTSIYLGLSQLCTGHKQYKKAHLYILKAIEESVSTTPKSRVDICVSLAWLCMLDSANSLALDILNGVESVCICTPHQLGIVYNLKGIALRRTCAVKEAAEHYAKALQISRDTGAQHNTAAALANFGILCLHLNAHMLSEHFLVKSVSVYSTVPKADGGVDFIHVLLILGHFYVSRIHKETGRLYYEWALLVAMEISHLESQLLATQILCHFYNTIVINEAQCIIYNEYQLSLARKMSDKVLEGQVLETISQLYLSLGTERACKSALEYTKRSLGIFIDLQKKEKEAFAWLCAGKIYYILGQNELVDLYVQVAQNVALSTGDPHLGMQLFEAAGDIFFNGITDRDKAVSFYRDHALPLAEKMGNMKTELRLCNKLAELLTSMKNYEECLEHAKKSLAISVSLENRLNERVAYHRLAGVYRHLGQCELAEHFYLKALSLCPSPLELEEEAVYYMKVYLILGDIIFYHLKDPFDASGYYHLALAAAMDLGNKKTQLKIYTRLAVIYHNFLIDREKSLYFYQKARTFASELNVRRINLSPNQGHPSTMWTCV
ncbi:SH3 domain and tetratricopeptide repeat-containing protein 1 [Spea bombifrons]|uniref:SH3 domain and tetratricopeptide repeat-containing protein 1 n=1 Tax=Spea bombifrons TaxID=233779 RepID=UPI00234B7FF3|nr:SH3 domain and tetratricopeptide repeat-containing protein 1 [Spea bombifrons]